MGKDVADDDLDTRKPITSCRASLVCYKILEEADSAGYLKRTAGILSIEPGRTAADSSLAFNSNEEGEVQHDLRVLLPNLKKKFCTYMRRCDAGITANCSFSCYVERDNRHRESI